MENPTNPPRNLLFLSEQQQQEGEEEEAPSDGGRAGGGGIEDPSAVLDVAMECVLVPRLPPLAPPRRAYPDPRLRRLLLRRLSHSAAPPLPARRVAQAQGQAPRRHVQPHPGRLGRPRGSMARPRRRAPRLPQGRPPPPHGPRRRRPRPAPPRPRARAPYPPPRQVLRLLYPLPPPPRTLLQVRDVLGDSGLEILAQKCKKLRRLRIEWGEDGQGLEDEQWKVLHVGLSSLALGCPELEYLAVYASDITNTALECFRMYSKKLYDFCFVLLDREERITDLPLDNGVRALLSGCNNLQRFSLYLRPGGLSDVGLGYIGECSGNIQYMLLGNVGVSDGGLMQFARACSNLQKLELRSCCFSEGALSHAALHLHSLRYLWVQGYQSSPNGRDLIAMVRPYWNIEFIPPRMEVVDADDGSQVAVERQAQILPYYSLAGRRSDLPEYVVSLHP